MAFDLADVRLKAAHLGLSFLEGTLFGLGLKGNQRKTKKKPKRNKRKPKEPTVCFAFFWAGGSS